MKATSWLGALRHLRNPDDVFLFLRIFFFAAAVPVILRLKLPRIETLLEPRKERPTTDSLRVEKIVHYVDAVLRLGRPLVRRGCLTRGLTLYYFLRGAGLTVKLCFGMGKPGDTFAGHCWLVKDGNPFLEARDPRCVFNVIYGFSQERAGVR